MRISGSVALVTGAASGLGRATADHLTARGAHVIGVDVETPVGEISWDYVDADVADDNGMSSAVAAAEAIGPVRILVHCAGIDAAARLLDRDGQPAPLQTFERIIRVNLLGTINAVRLAAAAMARAQPVDGERGVCVLTASIAAFDGQIGQTPYAAAKGGVVGLTLPAARDLASRLVRVAAIAPGIFDTPMVGRLPDAVQESLAASVPHPSRLGRPEEFAALAAHIVDNAMINGETIRLDGAIRMPPR